jgi:hypothetical protein
MFQPMTAPGSVPNRNCVSCYADRDTFSVADIQDTDIFVPHGAWWNYSVELLESDNRVGI